MIDFQKLERVFESARHKCEGKPLDRIESLHTTALRRRFAQMRNCRLRRINNFIWEVELHGNRIAHIRQLPQAAEVTVYNVEEFPTMTTAARLESVLNINIWKHDSKLRASARNITHMKDGRSYRQYPPLVNGQKFLIDRNGTQCINPEIVTEQRTRVLTDKAKPVLAMLRELRKLARPALRIGAVNWKDLEPYLRTDPLTSFRRIDDVPLSDMATVYKVCAAAARQRWHHMYTSRRLVESATIIPHELALELYEAGEKRLKDTLYSAMGVYEQYTYSFEKYFQPLKETTHEQPEVLRLAA